MTQLPTTHSVDVEQAMESLNYEEMQALAELYVGWAFNEENIDADWRTKLIQWASDYEAIANFCGSDWKATSALPGEMMGFMARMALGR